MLTEELETKSYNNIQWDYEQLVKYWKSDVKLEPVEFVFHQAMSLLAMLNQDVLRAKSHINSLESDVADYRAREATLDVMTLRGEVRALQARVNSLETSLKLINSK